MASLDTIRRVTIQATGADGIERIATAYQSAADAEAQFASAADKVASSTAQSEKGITSTAHQLTNYLKAVDPATRVTADFERKTELLKRSLAGGLFGPGEAGAKAFRQEMDLLRASTDQAIAKIVELQRAQERAKVAAGFQSLGLMGRSNLQEFDAARRISSMNTPDPAIEAARQKMIQDARAKQFAQDEQYSYNQILGIGGRGASQNGATFSALAEMADAQEKAAKSASDLEDRTQSLIAKFDPAQVAAANLARDMEDLAEAERLGIQITGGYEMALAGIIEKYDSAAAAAKRMSTATADAISVARAEQMARNAQEDINSRFGIGRSATDGRSLSTNVATFSALDAEMRRLDEIERARAQQAAIDSQQSLNDRFGIGRSSATAGGATFSALEERAAQQQMVEEARARQAAMDAQSSINQRFGIGGPSAVQRGASYSAFEDAARDAEKFEQQLKLLKLEIDPLGAAMDRLNEELLQYQALSNAGLISTQELAAAQSVAQNRYQMAAAQIAAVGRAGQMTTGQLVGMQYQLNDIAVSAASGQNLGTVFMQQGMQISQMFGPGESLASAGSSLAAGFMSMLTPINLAVVGVAALGYGISALWSAYDSGADKVEDSLERHGALIRELRDAYGDAAGSVEEYGNRSKEVLEFLAQRSNALLRDRMMAQVGDMLTGGSIGRQTSAMSEIGGEFGTIPGMETTGFAVEARYKAYEEAIRILNEEFKRGEPDLKAYQDRIVAVANAAGQTIKVRQAGEELLEMSKSAEEAQRKLQGLTDEWQRFADAFDAVAGVSKPTWLQDFADAQKDAMDVLRDSSSGLNNAGLTEYERKIAEINQRYDELKRQVEELGPAAAAGAVGLLDQARLNEIAAAAVEVSAAWKEMTDEFERQIDLMQNEIGLWGQSVEAVERYRTAVELLTEARRNDGVISEEERRRAFELADAQGAAARAVADAEYERSEAMKDANDAAGTGRTLVSGLIADLRAQADAATIALNALNRLADRMLDTALDDLFRPASPNAPGGIAGSGGIGFNFFARMFGAGVPAAGAGAPSDQALVDQVMGNAITASTVNVTAATVNINGYAPAGGGIPFPGTDAAGMPSAVGAGSPAAGAGRYSVPGGGSIPSDIVTPSVPGVTDEGLGYRPNVAAGGGLYGPPTGPPVWPQFDSHFGKFPGSDKPWEPYKFPNRFDEAQYKFMQSGEFTKDGFPGSVPAPQPAVPPGFSVPGALPPDGLPGFDSWRTNLTPDPPPVFPGAPLFSPAADGMASAASAAQQATQSFGELGGVLGAAAPQAGALGQALAGAFSAAPGGAGAGGGIFDLFGSLIGGGGAPVMLAGGGPVRGPGTETSDSIPAWLSDGEFIVNAKQARKHRSLLEAINDNTIMAFAAGGEVGGIPGYAMETMRSARRGGGDSGRSGPLVEIIDQRRKGSPDVQQKTLMGPNGEQRLRILIRDENAKSNAPGGLNDKNLSARSIRRPYAPR